ncbi:DUF1127 domain-containing protein [Mesorhizobium sp. CN5-321]|jgi:uncharacterized protein YjiS (DUF1127 family)|uniref:DUF1127 domain-containing protein n=1 Tax=Mesorhizobium hunchu TaxID=3157708 RepID=UPI0032B7A853
MSARSIDHIAATGTRGIVAFLLRTLAVWAGRRKQRLDLADLDDHLLRDIGVTRQEARRECAKRFWRGD